jgi:hypothetical protein
MIKNVRNQIWIDDESSGHIVKQKISFAVARRTSLTETHLGTIRSNDRHGGTANITGADAANI